MAVKERSFRKVLVANRGEIAVRVIRALRELGIDAVAVYSEVDRDSLAVRLADEAYAIGPAPSTQSYLRGDAIVELAQEVGADAVHPGYGFLSENAAFARLCAEAGVSFIGPPPEAIAAMGSKIESRRRMRQAGVPVVPGGEEALADLDKAREAAGEVGFPIMLKASAGGGGKGMRLVNEPGELEAAFRAATSESASSFGDSSVYIERYLERPRHVEIQILADQHGRVVSLGERECSLQRRHQKVLEEAPSAVVDRKLRARLGEAAVRAAEAVGYTGAGTVEFLLEPSGEFFFLEMNTRLQVEHPVTEMVTGVDLVREQIHIAQGRPLPDHLEGMEPRGHAIEVRLYAEDPFRGFAPSPGRIDLLRWPEGPGVRTDAGVTEGSVVTIHYDPLLAKLIVWGSDREQARERLDRALRELQIGGIRTTAPLYLALLRDADFMAADLDVGMLDRKLQSGALEEATAATTPLEGDLALIAAAVLHTNGSSSGSTPEDELGSPGLRQRWGEAGRREGMRRV